MIIGVYGLPRSGKDTFIEKAAKATNGLHVRGSETLNKIANDRFHCPFKELDDEKKQSVRVEFTSYVKRIASAHSTVFVDGHYAFPQDGHLKSVFTNADLDLYDIFIYLKRNLEDIQRNYKTGGKPGFEEWIFEAERVEEWTTFEIAGLKTAAEKEDKDFLVVDDDESALEFLFEIKRTSKEIALEITNEVLALSENKPIVLCDLDKTLSINDGTVDYIEAAKLDQSYPKRLFQGDFYTAIQFFRFHKWLANTPRKNKATQAMAAALEINEHLYSDLRRLKTDHYIVALTTGIKEAWYLRNKEPALLDRIYGTNENAGVIMTPLMKKIIAKYLTKNRQTLAIGDSIIDLGMLFEANKGYIVSMLKLDKRIIAALKTRKPNALYQPPYSAFKYESVTTKEIHD